MAGYRNGSRCRRAVPVPRRFLYLPVPPVMVDVNWGGNAAKPGCFGPVSANVNVPWGFDRVRVPLA